MLDGYCGAGGAAMGLHDVFPHAEIVGIDIKRQPRYPFTFIQADMLEYPWWKQIWDFLWMSPKCQKYSTMTAKWGRQGNHADQIPETRKRCIDTGVPYCIENVPGAPLQSPVLLCGSMFGLAVRRHRHFECSFPVLTKECRHDLQDKIVGVYGHAGGSSNRDGLVFGGTETWREAMRISWMTGNELAQAIPPAYSKYIAEQWSGRASSEKS